MQEKVTKTKFSVNNVSKTFDKELYFANLECILSQFNNEKLKDLSKNCWNYRPNVFSMKSYLEHSYFRYDLFYNLMKKYNSKKVLNIGGYFGVFDLTMANLHYDITLTEKYEYYGSLFKNVYDILISAGVKVLDIDPVTEQISIGQRYDTVLLLAVLEHIPHSPKLLFTNIKHLMNDEGILIIDVPNAAYWPKREKALRGKPTLHIENIYRSDTPYTGHHHEYTLAELKSIVEAEGFEILDVICYNYSINRPTSYIRYFPAILFKTCRECITLVAKKVSG